MIQHKLGIGIVRGSAELHPLPPNPLILPPGLFPLPSRRRPAVCCQDALLSVFRHDACFRRVRA